ncbi:MAG: putative AlkP superfamily pyrophosphatase or phosphodiesterase [bacterium]|jgi:predicted AlkP superfamily pyrophosphatase or phosphodiesterase
MEAYSRANPVQPADIDLYAQVNTLARRFSPDYMLIHMCAGDTLGHLYTSDSPEYRRQAWTSDNALARVMPTWLDLGYQIFVTADHGMNVDGQHGGNENLTRDVAFYYFGSQQCVADTNVVLDQRRVAPTIFQTLGVDPSVFPLPGILQTD